MPEATLSGQAVDSLAAAVREKGSLALAAFTVGLSPTELRRLMREDESLHQALADAGEVHAGLLYAEALKRAVEGQSDTLMAKLLEARVDGFSRESRVPVAQKGKPTGITMRTFDMDENGVVRDTGEPAPAPAPAPATAPAPAGAPLRITLRAGL
jgi:hypothetical protein